MSRDGACYGCDWLKVPEDKSPCKTCGPVVTKRVRWSDLIAQYKANMPTIHRRATPKAGNKAIMRDNL